MPLADALVDDYDVINLRDRLVGRGVELLTVDAAALMLVDPDGCLRACHLDERGSRVPGADATTSPARARLDDTHPTLGSSVCRT